MAAISAISAIAGLAQGQDSARRAGKAASDANREKKARERQLAEEAAAKEAARKKAESAGTRAGFGEGGMLGGRAAMLGFGGEDNLSRGTLFGN